ncbi:GNAT family N-acetyltransferase [Paenibacillus sp. UNC451MF]|uniref:GNAT family N-acetyltransferase n=1 Tax=Paenibacillus sp. UNC451MF TaxID=1449063 RepID=UPI00048D5883|nr:GNAT family N-acetyltransferase [Paenibacillus sp. UNC451MF]
MLHLETDRLFLREYTDEDFEPLHAIFSDQEMMQYYPAPFSIDKTLSWIERNYTRYQTDGFGLWAVCLKETEECIGDCGLVKQTVEGSMEVEIGYHIHKRYWGEGYATEAAIACKRYGFQQLGLNKLISIINPGNLASIRVAEKIGFTKEKELFIFNKHHWIYSGVADK